MGISLTDTRSLCVHSDKHTRENGYFSFSYVCKSSSLNNTQKSANQGCPWDGNFPPLPYMHLPACHLAPGSPRLSGHSRCWSRWPSPIPHLHIPPLEFLNSSQYPFPVWATFQGIAISSDHSSSILKIPHVYLNPNSSCSCQGWSPRTHSCLEKELVCSNTQQKGTHAPLQAVTMSFGDHSLREAQRWMGPQH